MTIGSHRIDHKTGQFLPTPVGQKPPKLLEMESKLNLKFEDDYIDNYLNGNLGQKRFAQRWGVARNLIFANNKNSRRRSWHQMLGLQKKATTDNNISKSSYSKHGCEVCGEENVSLDRAHWRENSKGGSSRVNNILLLCPNCHRKLDRGESTVTEKCREVLLFREIKKIFDSKTTSDSPKLLLELCKRILKERQP